jgi:phosphate transport system substrate-binding protein
MKTAHLFRSLFVILGAAVGSLSSQAAITARGSDSTIAIVKALAAAFQQKSGTAVQVDGGGSGAGAKAAIAGEVQLAFLSRALDAKEIEGGLVGVAYASDAVAVIVHKDNPVNNLTLAELKNYFTGAATDWPDGRPVVLYNRNSDSGTREIFQDKVLGKGVAFSPTAAVKHDGVLLGSVAKIPATLAYDGFGHADPKVVKLVSVNGVAPSPETIRSSAYPLTRTPTLATKGEAAGEVKAFIDFTLSPEGQAVVAANGLLTLK